MSQAATGGAKNHCTNAATDTPEWRFRVQFSASAAFMARLERVRVLASHRLPANASLEQVFALALEYFIEREDATKRHARRERRAEKLLAEKANAEKARAEVVNAQKQRADTPRQNPPRGRRSIPARVRDAVFVRDGGRCAFVGANGARCGSTRVLQVDHIRPVALGGENHADNLRLLCAYHNRFEAERLLNPQGSPVRWHRQWGPEASPG